MFSFSILQAEQILKEMPVIDTEPAIEFLEDRLPSSPRTSSRAEMRAVKHLKYRIPPGQETMRLLKIEVIRNWSGFCMSYTLHEMALLSTSTTQHKNTNVYHVSSTRNVIRNSSQAQI